MGGEGGRWWARVVIDTITPHSYTVGAGWLPILNAQTTFVDGNDVSRAFLFETREQAEEFAAAAPGTVLFGMRVPDWRRSGGDGR